jgi:transcriptional regulator with XRE-family HTH domain
MTGDYARIVGERIRQRREELGLTQAKLAERVDSASDSGRISRWELGKDQPRAKALRELAQALDVGDDYFAIGRREETVDEEVRDLLIEVRNLVAKQNSLLQRQSDILEGIESARTGLQTVVDQVTQATAVFGPNGTASSQPTGATSEHSSSRGASSPSPE